MSFSGSSIISIVVAAVASNAAAPNGGANDPRLAATRYLLSRISAPSTAPGG